MKVVNNILQVVEDSANASIDSFFKFKRVCLIVFMWMCIICTVLTFNIFTGALAFFVFYYLKRDKEREKPRYQVTLVKRK